MNIVLIVLSVVVGLVVIGIAVFAVLDIKGVTFKPKSGKKNKQRNAKNKSKAAKPAQKSAAQKQPEPVKHTEPGKEPEPVKESAVQEREESEEPEEPAAVAAVQAEDKEEETEQGEGAQAVISPQRNENSESSDDSADEEERVEKLVTVDGKTKYIVIKYSKSFLAKLIQSDDDVKAAYSRIKNELLSYKGVKSRTSWRWETFRAGRATVARLRIRGKTLSLALPLNAAEYEDSKYVVEDFSSVKSFADTPCVYRIKNDRRLGYSADLIARVAQEKGLEKIERGEEDFASLYPYETTAALLEKKLIRELTDEDASTGTAFAPRKSVTVAEADTLIADEDAEALVTAATESEDLAYKGKGGKTDIVNIDTLSRYFKDGETVTLEEIKKRIKDVSPRASAIKVLARGTLDKKLIVYADAFSLQAVKMIVLTGGKAIRL